MPRRWYQDPALSLAEIEAVTREHALQTRETPHLPTEHNMAHLISNPIDAYTRHGAELPRPTDTVGARDVFHQAQAALRPLLGGVQTQEQLDSLIERIGDIQHLEAEERHLEGIHDPLPISRKGRPRNQRITNALEGRQRGGGAGTRPTGARPFTTRRKPQTCSFCHAQGHNCSTCPAKENDMR
ncbi:hypothetical protein DXG01_010307 [Tephrocybe rancida]|nr:hypothetical protein DXG01_010307 [Tephrocybe rancida]